MVLPTGQAMDLQHFFLLLGMKIIKIIRQQSEQDLFDFRYKGISYHQKGHKGVDIAAPAGTPIKSSISGEVIGVFDNDTQGYRGYGNSVLVKGKDDMYYFYAHMSSVNVQIGDKVKSGDVLGGVGSTGNSTGNHLHFEIRTGGEWNSSKVNPHDYIDY